MPLPPLPLLDTGAGYTDIERGEDVGRRSHTDSMVAMVIGRVIVLVREVSRYSYLVISCVAGCHVAMPSIRPLPMPSASMAREDPWAAAMSECNNAMHRLAMNARARAVGILHPGYCAGPACCCFADD